MKKSTYYIFLIFLILSFFSCSKHKSPTAIEEQQYRIKKMIL